MAQITAKQSQHSKSVLTRVISFVTTKVFTLPLGHACRDLLGAAISADGVFKVINGRRAR
jgi:hypothetical protein